MFILIAVASYLNALIVLLLQGIDLNFARHAQMQRDKEREVEEAKNRMRRRMFLTTELQRNWSGGPRVPAKIRYGVEIQ